MFNRAQVDNSWLDTALLRNEFHVFLKLIQCILFQFPADWFEGLPEKMFLAKRYDIKTNKYGVGVTTAELELSLAGCCGCCACWPLVTLVQGVAWHMALACCCIRSC